ncbi:zinc finger protein ZAT11-like [Quercus lobata]|uniref:C2H2-type domain-containing protein n=1 Tax=Quercus lobata TaxID=97700 RepID=A0A7N2MDR2_QUELO|nr:zinc finger protein ZAT11-like [Quercus lobata]
MAEEKHHHHLFHHKKDEEDKPIESVFTETTTGYAETGFSSGGPGGYGDETWDCVVCGKRFVSKNALGGHMNQHPKRPWRGLYPPPAGHHAPEACVVCGKRFVSKNALGVHMNQHPERPWRGLYPPPTDEPAAVRNGNTTAPLLIDLNQPAP